MPVNMHIKYKFKISVVSQSFTHIGWFFFALCTYVIIFLRFSVNNGLSFSMLFQYQKRYHNPQKKKGNRFRMTGVRRSILRCKMVKWSIAVSRLQSCRRCFGGWFFRWVWRSPLVWVHWCWYCCLLLSLFSPWLFFWLWRACLHFCMLYDYTGKNNTSFISNE